MSDQEHPAPVGTKEALEIAARQFRQYEAHHQAQADAIHPDKGHNYSAVARLVEEKMGRSDKADANRLMAEMCERAAAEVIDPPTPTAAASAWPETKDLVMPRADGEAPGDPVLEALAFACRPWDLVRFARVLQAAGWPIPKKAEAEYAAALHWLVGHARNHPKDWRTTANTELNQMINAASAAQETK